VKGEDIKNTDIITEEGRRHPHLKGKTADDKRSHIIIAGDIIIIVITDRTEIVIHHQEKRRGAQAYHQLRSNKSLVLSETLIN
jgi:hypothetical protein